MFNFRDSNTTLKRVKDVAAASSVAKEGSLMMSVLEDGVEKVQPCAGGAGEVPVGFSMLDNESFVDDVAVETITVPATAPYTVTLANGSIAGTGPASYEVRVPGVTQNAGVAAGQFAVTNAAGGVLTFNVAEAGTSYTVTYRYNLTAAQAIVRGLTGNTADGGPGQRAINNLSSAQFKQVTVMTGHGEIFTKEFDVLVDWSAAAPTIKTAAGGRVTIGGGGTTLTQVRVIKVPSESDPHLGLAIDMTA